MLNLDQTLYGIECRCCTLLFHRQTVATNSLEVYDSMDDDHMNTSRFLGNYTFH